jgi:hypothetical protein
MFIFIYECALEAQMTCSPYCYHYKITFVHYSSVLISLQHFPAKLLLLHVSLNLFIGKKVSLLILFLFSLIFSHFPLLSSLIWVQNNDNYSYKHNPVYRRLLFSHACGGIVNSRKICKAPSEEELLIEFHMHLHTIFAFNYIVNLLNPCRFCTTTAAVAVLLTHFTHTKVY